MAGDEGESRTEAMRGDVLGAKRVLEGNSTLPHDPPVKKQREELGAANQTGQRETTANPRDASVPIRLLPCHQQQTLTIPPAWL